MSGDLSGTARLQALHDRLVAAVESIHSGEDWARMLKVAARLHSYSPGNLLLLWSQAAERGWDPTTIGPFGGYRALQSIGRQVRKGERGLAVLAPIVRRPSMTNRGHGYVDPEDDVPRPAIVGFRVVHVFDVGRQTDGEPLPEPPMPELLQGVGREGLTAALESQIRDAGFSVAYGELAPANGVTDFAARSVTIADRLPPAAAAKTAAHELAHILLGHEAESWGCRGRVEVEAESVAFLVATASGLDASSYSFPYVARWASEPAVVQQVAERVIPAAREILAGIDGPEARASTDSFVGVPAELVISKADDLSERARALGDRAARAQRRRLDAARAHHQARRDRGAGLER